MPEVVVAPQKALRVAPRSDVRTVKKRKRADQISHFPQTARSPPGYSTIATLLTHPVQNLYFNSLKITKKGIKKVLPVVTDNTTQGAFPNRARAQKLMGTIMRPHGRPDRNSYRQHTANTAPVSNAHTTDPDITVSASVP